MAYTLTQARTLLTPAELALFDASRTQPVRALTAAALRGKITRARTLRDKYRDVYRRQTVSTRGAPAARRSAVGGDNERTQRKADLFAEVLGRFEQRLQKLQPDATPAAPAAPAKKAKPATLKSTVAKALKATPVTLPSDVARALKTKTATPPKQGAERSAKAPAAKRPARSVGAAAVPLDVAPGAERSNPLRQRSDNLAIHAHSKSQGRRVQGKRDSA